MNQPITVNTNTATYDALGRMVELHSESTYKQFVFRPSGQVLAVYSGGLVKGTIALPGGGTAIYNASGLNFSPPSRLARVEPLSHDMGTRRLLEGGLRTVNLW